jgi:hypothetical protein
VFCAGIQRQFDFTKPESIDVAELTAEMNTNYNAVVTMIAYFLPHLLKHGVRPFHDLFALLGVLSWFIAVSGPSWLHYPSYLRTFQ